MNTAQSAATAWLEVLNAGAYASIQDRGRRGWRRAGVPWSGALDERLLRIANVLVGNEEYAPALECFDGGQCLRAHGGTVQLAVAGAALIDIDGEEGRRGVASWRSILLAEGETLRVRSIEQSRLAVVAVAGLACATQLGSASTYARAALGGVDGEALSAGQRLPVQAGASCQRFLPVPPAPPADTFIRALAGPQDDHFSAAALRTFWSSEFRVDDAADRMGMRLLGPQLEHGRGGEIVSDATVPGAIQVPGNGQPIVLFADAQTAGGYPKIATVVSADLGRLAALRPGTSLRFVELNADAAARSAREYDSATRALLATVRTMPAFEVDLAALYAANLVDGVFDARGNEESRK